MNDNEDNYKIKGYITDPEDRASLEFFLTADRDELKAWNAIATEHDVLYASELMQAYARELEFVAVEQRVELELEAVHPHYTEAACIINHIRYFGIN